MPGNVRSRTRAAHRHTVGTWGPMTLHPVGTLAHMPDVEAHITGTVWKIECALGDAVAQGDTVVVLESMKMEMPVEAEDTGTVSAIHVAEGQAVREGEPLVTLE
jgi:acetyl-CoA carboxylase biotin carboxyl carrier protein